MRSIAADGRGEGGGGGSLGLRGRNRETLQVTLQREWGALAKTAELRRTAAGLLLDHLLSTLPPGTRGTDLLAETTMGKLLTAVKSDLILKSQIRHPDRLMDRALLWLHEQEVVRLNKGLAVFRPAMTILLKPEQRGFARADFASLQLHYDEQIRQIHVMAEYAQHGLSHTADHLKLAMDYFILPEQEFLDRWLPDRDQEISRQTTRESWRAIVESLNNPIQRRMVADDREQTNVLVLAGPGSGKTRVLVHRIAYMIRVRRENPRGILALAYNRHAAVEIRRRLADLIGDNARGVTVLTCHALAMRLVGASFASRANRLEQGEFQEVIWQAVALLRGDGLPSEEADEHRERLLAGFRWILVDEYQDIGPDQYDLISALAGRTLAEADDRLSLFAVGDDDQNIYAFNGASTEFIRRFGTDYGARPSFLTDNYRSTGNIIAAANAVIEPARDRMKEDHPIVVNRARTQDPPGGDWTLLDPVARGRVQILPAGDNPISQAQEAVAEYVLETGGAETPVDSFIEWLAEWGREVRRRQRGLLLLTAHRAKGLEFDHVVVLDGGWDRATEGEDAAAPVLRGHDPCQTDPHVDAFPREASVPGCFVEYFIGPAPTRACGAHTARARAEPLLTPAQLARRVSGLRRLPGPENPVHAAISALSPGDPLQARMGADRWELLDQSGTVVGQLARGFKAASGVRCAFATVMAIVEWDRERSDPDYRDGLRCENWEVVVPEIVFEPVV